MRERERGCWERVEMCVEFFECVCEGERRVGEFVRERIGEG